MVLLLATVLELNVVRVGGIVIELQRFAGHATSFRLGPRNQNHLVFSKGIGVRSLLATIYGCQTGESYCKQLS